MLRCAITQKRSGKTFVGLPSHHLAVLLGKERISNLIAKNNCLGAINHLRVINPIRHWEGGEYDAP